MLSNKTEFVAQQDKQSPKAFFKITIRNGLLAFDVQMPLSWAVLILSVFLAIIGYPNWIEVLLQILRVK